MHVFCLCAKYDTIYIVWSWQYVIKKLNLRTSSRRERRAAEQEAQLLSQLKHPNIVTYRESWEGEDCQLYIAMGFCEGGDLYHRLKQQKGELLPERQVVEWFVQIAMALQVSQWPSLCHPSWVLSWIIKLLHFFIPSIYMRSTSCIEILKHRISSWPRLI